MSKPVLIVVNGIPGSGKTTLAQEVDAATFDEVAYQAFLHKVRGYIDNYQEEGIHDLQTTN